MAIPVLIFTRSGLRGVWRGCKIIICRRGKSFTKKGYEQHTSEEKAGCKPTGSSDFHNRKKDRWSRSFLLFGVVATLPYY